MTYSTAFVAPTLQEIFNKLPSVNKLLPEKDNMLEGGFELTVSNKLVFNAIYFYRKESDKIGFDFNTFQTINDLGSFYANGLEAELDLKINKHLSFNANYGYIDRDPSLLLKIPSNTISIKMSYSAEKTNYSVNGKFVDSTNDFGNVSLPSYRMVDFFINRKVINNRLALFASVTNLFNEEFQEIFGFSTKGRNYKIGLQLNF
jgi:vitamin B12 transporter